MWASAALHLPRLSVLLLLPRESLCPFSPFVVIIAISPRCANALCPYGLPCSSSALAFFFSLIVQQAVRDTVLIALKHNYRCKRNKTCSTTTTSTEKALKKKKGPHSHTDIRFFFFCAERHCRYFSFVFYSSCAVLCVRVVCLRWLLPRCCSDVLGSLPALPPRQGAAMPGTLPRPRRRPALPLLLCFQAST